MTTKNKSNLVLYLAVLASIVFWLLDALIDTLFFDGDESLFESIFQPTTHEIYMRSTVLILFLIVSYIARILLKQQEKISHELENHKYNLEELVAKRTEQLEKLATIDDLTQIYNRRKFFEMAKYEIERDERYQHPLSVIMIDIDHFKDVNDLHGHQAGDQTLQIISKAILSIIRTTDIFGRIGGEEFSIVLPETSKQDAKNLAERIRVCIENETFPGIGNLTVCLGVTQLFSDDRLNSIFNRADIALYAAKNGGRNRVISA